MFYRSFITLIVLLFTFSFALSQGFVVTGSYPSNGQAGLPTTPISVLFKLYFSEPVNLNATWPRENIPIGPFNFLAFDPIDSVEFGEPYFTPMFDTVGIFVKLRPQTDYCVILYGAYSQSGILLDKPYVVNFTTSPSTGTISVSGVVTPPSNPRISFPVNFPGINPENFKLKLPAEIGGKKIDLNVSEKIGAFNLPFKNLNVSQPLKIAGVDPNVGVVALLDGNPFSENDARVKYAGNISNDFSFKIRYVREGTYYLFAVFDTQRDGIINVWSDLVMFYDEDGDGWPDPINVSGDLSGLNINGVFQVKPFTLREKLDIVRTLAQNYANDAVLREINGYEGPIEIREDTLDGKFYFAGYKFYSPSKGSFAVWIDAFGGAFVDSSYLSGSVNLPNTFVDSDVAFGSAEANGGFSFRNEPGTVTLIGYELRNYPNDETAPDTSNPYWRLTYYKTDTSFSPVGILTFYLDPSNGRVVKKFEIGFRPVTAKEKFNMVDSVAMSYASDAKLMYVLGVEDSVVDGKCYLWYYGYRSQTKGEFSVSLFFGMPGIDTSGWFLNSVLENFGITGVSLTRELNFGRYKNSDELSAVVEANGGAFFRSRYNLLGLLYLYSQSPIDTARIYFHSAYAGFDTTKGTLKLFVALVDPVTGGFIGGFTQVEKDATAGIPSNFALYQNYPNPFNPATTITYDLPVRTNVRLVVYNVLGQEVAVLVNEVQEPGRYNVKFDASHLPSGVYFYKLETEKFVQVRKMVLVK